MIFKQFLFKIHKTANFIMYFVKSNGKTYLTGIFNKKIQNTKRAHKTAKQEGLKRELEIVLGIKNSPLY